MASISEIQSGPFVEDDDSSGFVTEEDGSDDGAASDVSDIDDLDKELAAYNPHDETLSERLYALRDVLSPTTRKRLAEAWTSSSTWATWGGKLAGNAVWVVTTSALLVGLPLALSIENETMMVQQEKEMYAQQQGAQQMMGSTTPGSSADSGLRPPGF